MAEIFVFPAGDGAIRRNGNDAGVDRPVDVPDRVWDAVESVRSMRRVPGLRYREIPVPSSAADFGIGVEIMDDTGAHTDDGRAAGGWIMLLYSAVPQPLWRSRWRCAAFARIPLEERERDGMASSMYWDEMKTSLDAAGVVGHDSIGGTVTVTRNDVFGALDDADTVGCEMRVSWTPLEHHDGGVDAGAQVRTWAGFIRAVAVEEEPSVDR